MRSKMAVRAAVLCLIPAIVPCKAIDKARQVNGLAIGTFTNNIVTCNTAILD